MSKTIPTVLLPCPFCGHDLDAKWNRPNPKARCLTEGCKGRQLPVLNLDHPDDITAWNQRADGDYAVLKNSMNAIMEHLGLDPENLPSGSYSEIVIGAIKTRHPVIEAALAKTIHYPDCWDTAAYPNLADALAEIWANEYHCTECRRASSDVLAERRRQITAEGFTPEHDDALDNAELSTAAACYALAASDPDPDPLDVPGMWPFGVDWYTPSADRRRNLVKAGALILAEIDRLDRAEKGA